jgi:hypothetical protein
VAFFIGCSSFHLTPILRSQRILHR